jgi:hypothetical protein
MPALFVLCAVLTGAGSAAEPRRPYVVVGTAQVTCYDNRREIEPPQPGQPFHGQDAQHPGVAPSYTLSDDRLTVLDNNTGLTWQRSADTNHDGRLDSTDKLGLRQAETLSARLNAERFGGCADWRLPTIKELYSLIVFSGRDPSGPAGRGAQLTPFIDTRCFAFAYGDERAGERIIDAQYVSATRYVGRSQPGPELVFGVNFADGRIKGYGVRMPGGGGEKTFFVLCVRGNPRYGRNDFADHGDGTITDRATGLMWSKADSGTGLDWAAALAWVQARNAERWLGHRDWRLPNVKELQSIVDYGRCPDATNSPAIDPVFTCSPLTNEAGKPDWPFYWSSTTHASLVGGGFAAYVAFGRAAGWPTGMPGRGGPGFGGPPPSGQGAPRYVDVHGAGAQRSDPKTGDPRVYPYGHGPQGDVVRILNHVRCVRG